MTTRKIDQAAFTAATTVAQTASALGYEWADWKRATIAERDDAVKAALAGAAEFTPRDDYPSDDERAAAFLAALKGA